MKEGEIGGYTEAPMTQKVLCNALCPRRGPEAQAIRPGRFGTGCWSVRGMHTAKIGPEPARI